MTFKLALFLFSVKVVYLNGAIFTGNEDIGAALVVDCIISRGEASVKVHNLFYHADVPDTDHAIRVARGDTVSTNVE